MKKQSERVVGASYRRGPGNSIVARDSAHSPSRAARCPASGTATRAESNESRYFAGIAVLLVVRRPVLFPPSRYQRSRSSGRFCERSPKKASRSIVLFFRLTTLHIFLRRTYKERAPGPRFCSFHFQIDPRIIIREGSAVRGPN